MPKICMKTTLAGPDHPTAFPGDVVDVTEEQAKDLVDGGFATRTDEDPVKSTGRHGSKVEKATVAAHEEATLGHTKKH